VIFGWGKGSGFEERRKGLRVGRFKGLALKPTCRLLHATSRDVLESLRFNTVAGG